MRYDPALSPEPDEWLGLGEDEQIALIEDYHLRDGIDLPQARLHAAIHAVIERQLAMRLPAVLNAFDRLGQEGLDRHDAIHAVGAVLAEHMRQLLTEELNGADPNAAYFADLDRLSATSWRSQFGLGDRAT